MKNVSGALTIANCTFRDNHAATYGGGMYNFQSTPTIRDCAFLNNRTGAGGAGGGMANRNADTVVRGTAFAKNSAATGGGVYNLQGAPQFANCVFFDNTATTGNGGGISNENGSVSITNCSFSGNSGFKGGAVNSFSSTRINITNSILWENPSNEIETTADSSLTISHSDVKGQFMEIKTNLTLDPLFANPTMGDLRLGAGSPCIDAADGSTAPETDMEGNPRQDIPTAPNKGAGDPAFVDMGAYEFQPIE